MDINNEGLAKRIAPETQVRKSNPKTNPVETKKRVALTQNGASRQPQKKKAKFAEQDQLLVEQILSEFIKHRDGTVRKEAQRKSQAPQPLDYEQEEEEIEGGGGNEEEVNGDSETMYEGNYANEEQEDDRFSSQNVPDANADIDDDNEDQFAGDAEDESVMSIDTANKGSQRQQQQYPPTNQ